MSERLYEYFASEATEYLDQLEGLLSQPGRPDLEQLLRLARGVRGSAQMAGADTLVSVAERLEEGLRAVQSDHVAWSEEIRGLTHGTVADLKILVRASSRWGRAEEARVRAALARWDEMDPAGVARGAHPGPIVPIESLFYDDEGPHILGGREEETMHIDDMRTGDPVPIETLLLAPGDAIAEALAMRNDIERMVAAAAGGTGLAGRIEELFELLEIAAGGHSRG